jgi:hypothetical protein
MDTGLCRGEPVVSTLRRDPTTGGVGLGDGFRSESWNSLEPFHGEPLLGMSNDDRPRSGSMCAGMGGGRGRIGLGIGLFTPLMLSK